MNRFDNPFHDLWLTEILNSRDFVQMFSPNIARLAEDVFGSGNVVVKGRQGSGKSMLLRLLDTNTRLAYARSSEPNPYPPELQFVAASINLTKSNFSAISARLGRSQPRDERDWAAATFADYLNYYLAQDLIKNVINLKRIQDVDQKALEVLPLSLNQRSEAEFVSMLSRDDSWYGALDGCSTLDELEQRINSRLTEYRSYFNFNSCLLYTSPSPRD